MAKTEILQIISTATSSSAGAAYIDIPYNCTVVAISGDIVGLAGAATNQYFRDSVSKNATDGSSTLNAKGEMFAMSSAGNISGGSFAANHAVQGIAYALRQGERVYLNVQLTGTAASSASHRCQLHVVV